MSGIDALITNGAYRSALGSIDYSSSGYQILTFPIGLGIIFAMSTLAGTFIAIQSEDQNMSTSNLEIVAALDVVAIIVLLLCFIFYLRNIGRYTYSRFKPVFALPENSVKCVS